MEVGIDKLFGPAINKVLLTESNLNLSNVLLFGSALVLLYLVYKKKNVDVVTDK